MQILQLINSNILFNYIFRIIHEFKMKILLGKNYLKIYYYSKFSLFNFLKLLDNI